MGCLTHVPVFFEAFFCANLETTLWCGLEHLPLAASIAQQGGTQDPWVSVTTGRAGLQPMGAVPLELVQLNADLFQSKRVLQELRRFSLFGADHPFSFCEISSGKKRRAAFPALGGSCYQDERSFADDGSGSHDALLQGVGPTAQFLFLLRHKHPILHMTWRDSIPEGCSSSPEGKGARPANRPVRSAKKDSGGCWSCGCGGNKSVMVADLDAMEGVLGVVDPVAASDAPLGVEPPNPSGLGDIVAQLQSHHASPGPLSLRGYQDNWDMKRQLEERLSRREICELAQWYHLTLELLLGSLVNCLRLDPDRMARFADNMPTPVHRTFFSAVLPFPSMRPVSVSPELDVAV